MKKRGVITMMVIVIVAILVQYWVLGSIAVEKRANREQQARIYGQSIANAISLTMENILEATEALKYIYLQYGDACFDDFEEIASNIAADNPVTASLYIAPDGVIEVAYPAKVNESTIGFRMLEDPEQGPRAQLAKDSGKITVAGPHDLVEGGIGFIIRNPMYRDGEFIGFTIIVLDWDEFGQEILQNADVPENEYKFAVWKDDKDETAVTDADGFILRSTDEPISNRVDIEFHVPNDVWHLYVEPEDGWLVYREMLPDILTSILCSTAMVLLLLFVNILYERKRELMHQQLENETKSMYMNQLQEALDQARSADAAKTTFLSRMSHDIRTPLNGIIGLLAIDEKHPEDVELLKENRKKMQVSANHLLSLISDVLMLSKMDNEHVELAREAFSLLELGNDIEMMTKQRAIDRGLTFNSEITEKSLPYPYVYGSPLHVRQLFLNIFSNAIKYNKEHGAIYATAKLISLEDHIVTYRFEISDTGCGMSEEFQKHIFEPFSQEHTDARSTFQGTGLGMAIVKSLTDKMNGTIEVKSKEGEGSTFIVTLPFELADEKDLPKKSTVSEVNLKGMRILLVEDNQLNMEIARTLLEDEGVEITEAWNGKEAVDLFTESPARSFDVILMDLMMPVMDGYAATKAIRSSDHEDAVTIPIVAMTANAFVEDAQKCYQAGMNEHLSKPINVEVLLTTLSRLKRA